MNGKMGRYDIERITAGTIIDAAERAMSSEDIKEREDAVWLLDHLVCLHNTQSERTEVLPEKVVKADNALDEGRRGGVVHDVGDREVDAGRKKVRCVFDSLVRVDEAAAEKFDSACRIAVQDGVVVGDCLNQGSCIIDGGGCLFGFHADYFTKFKTPGWRPKTGLDLAMTAMFAMAMLGEEKGKAWFVDMRTWGWRTIHGEED